MKKRLLALLLAVCFSLSFVACGSKTQTVQLDQFKTPEGLYKYIPIPYGQTVSEIEQLLGIAPEGPVLGTEDSKTYRIQDVFELEGKPVTLELEFHDEKLHAVVFMQKTEKGSEEFFTQLYEKLVELYGEPAMSVDNTDGPIPMRGHNWRDAEDVESLTSILQLDLMANTDGSSVLRLAVSRVPN